MDCTTRLHNSSCFISFFWWLEAGNFHSSLTVVDVLNILATTQRAAFSEILLYGNDRYLSVYVIGIYFQMLFSFTAPKPFPETMKQSEQQQTAETTSAAAVHSVKGSNLQSSTVRPTEALKGKFFFLLIRFLILIIYLLCLCQIRKNIRARGDKKNKRRMFYFLLCRQKWKCGE